MIYDHETQMGRFFEELKQNLRTLVNFYPDNTAIYFSEVADQESLNKAIDWAAYLQKEGIYGGERVGIVDPNLPDLFSLGSLRRGQIVFYAQEEDGTTIVKVPWSLNRIIEQRKQGSLLSNDVIINFPPGYIKDLTVSPY